MRAGEPDSHAEAVSAAAASRSLGVAGAQLVAHLALAEAAADPLDEDEQRAEAAALARETGLRAPGDVGRAQRQVTDSAGDASSAPLSIRLLGGFELALSGQQADLSALRPRVRILLRLLALNAGRRVHHETIEAALWPEADAASSERNLHVAIAALRRVIEPAATRGRSSSFAVKATRTDGRTRGELD